jgi:hypothetical protein
VDDALGIIAAVLDELTDGIDDPAHLFAQSFRVMGRLHRRDRELSKVFLHTGPVLVSSTTGMVLQARGDIRAAVDAGRFTVHDLDLDLVTVVGAALCLGQLLHDHPDRDDAEATDQIAEDLLRMLGLPADEARDICRRPLPRARWSARPRRSQYHDMACLFSTDRSVSVVMQYL